MSSPLKLPAAATALLCLGVLAMVGVMAVYGEKGKLIRKEREAAQTAFQAKLRAMPQPLELTIGAKGPSPLYWRGWNNQPAIRTTTGWTTWETTEMMLVSQTFDGVTLCPQLLEDFLAANGYEDVKESVLTGYAQKLAGRKLPVWVRPAHYPTKPDLSRCPDFDWDAETRALRLRGKPMAFFAAHQPNLALAMSQR